MSESSCKLLRNSTYVCLPEKTLYNLFPVQWVSFPLPSKYIVPVHSGRNPHLLRLQIVNGRWRLWYMQQSWEVVLIMGQDQALVCLLWCCILHSWVVVGNTCLPLLLIFWCILPQGRIQSGHVYSQELKFVLGFLFSLQAQIVFRIWERSNAVLLRKINPLKSLV